MHSSPKEQSSAVFITASGTEIGKTHVACGLIEAARASAIPVQAIKPVASGVSRSFPEITQSDPGRLLQAMQQEITESSIDAIAPWCFAAPISPPLAAQREGHELALAEVSTWVHDQHRAFSHQQHGRGLFLVEGAGGVMAPLTNHGHSMLDWMVALGMPVILVTGSYLGSISHTLTAYRCLQQASLEVRAVVLSESTENPMPLHETLKSLRPYVEIPIHVLERHGESVVKLELYSALLKDIIA
jgi:dethiobiotin synthetase